MGKTLAHLKSREKTIRAETPEGEEGQDDARGEMNSGHAGFQWLHYGLEGMKLEYLLKILL